MKKWSVIVAGLYGLVVLVLIGPLMPSVFKLSDTLMALQSWQLWAVVALMIVTQFALLRIPVYFASRRPISQRPLLATIIAAAFMMGLLVFGAAASIYEFLTRLQGSSGLWLSVAVGLGSWVFWCIYFYRLCKRNELDQKLTNIRRFLWTGSILELLIAVPTHVVARHRDYCCAGMVTFLGLTCGISVMLFAFGPAVYFLFLERWKRLHPSRATALPNNE